ncbi:MAG: Uma2 family endonuclease [Treponema sp.]|jgi:Uma2 family endonuclease|nr:Uma2 family endonuclease [Treponema sp.]
MSELARDDYRYTYNDYCEIDDSNRYEVIDGELYMMSSPSSRHQLVVGEMYVQLYEKLQGKSCTPYVSPMDVRLFYEEDGLDDTVVQPDVFVVCDKDKNGKNSINGAPDFVIEVLSPSNSIFEIILKQEAYERSGVKEYWMIDSDKKELMMFELVDSVFYGERKKLAGVEKVKCLGINVDLDRVISVIST